MFMKGMTLERMAQACHARLCGAPADQKTIGQAEAAGIVIDSRQVEKDYLFI